MAQVKFYSTTAADYAAQVSANTVNGGGVYFVDGGELYKGTQRFGLGRVTVDASFVPSTSTKDGQARGDIVVTGTGAGWVFDGEHWQSVGGDIGTITSSWQADISTWTAGLSVGDANSYITSISQAADGKVTASAVAFPTLATGTTDGTLKLGSGADAKVSGWDTVKTDISNLQAVVSYSGSGDSVVTATTGSFTNLTVTSTATFSATTVSADTLTIGGSTVEQLADKQIAAISAVTESGTDTNAGITVSVTTSSGSVETVTVAGPSIATEIRASGTADDTRVASEKAVRDAVNAAVSTLDNAMHFVGVTSDAGMAQDWTGTPSDIDGYSAADKKEGDIVLAGVKEYVWNGSKWEQIGDQNVLAYSNLNSTVIAGATTLPTAVTNLASAVDTINANLGTAASLSYSTEVANDSTLPTGAAVTTFVGSEITTSINALSSNVSSSNQTGLTVSVVETSGVITGVQAELVWLDADGDPL